MPFLPASRDCLARCVSSVGWHVGLFSLGLNTYGERGRGGGGEEEGERERGGGGGEEEGGRERGGGREEREEGEKRREGKRVTTNPSSSLSSTFSAA